MTNERYETRINRALALIDRHIDQDLSIERLADEACLSPFHFHRIFSALTGESVHAMTTRMRMERALALTRRVIRPQWKAIAGAVGYRSQDVFTRAFKRHFGCTPSAFDLEKYWRGRTDRDDALAVSRYFLRPALPLPPDFKVEIVDRPAANLIISRAVGVYLDPTLIVAAYERIDAFSKTLGIAMPGRLAGASRDDPELVPLSRCRYDFSLEVLDGTRASKGLQAARRDEGRWAVTHVEGDFAAVDRAWNLLFKSWLPASGHNLRPAAAEEIYNQTPNEIGWDRFDVTLAIPLED
ncbi:AraC family transcriptional regulator [Erythrobacter insulae]|uniref:AraC family transcriptional regulator n=1 Tax=Erythrobacter insulae TaxID=2584124 RepID=A0A547PA01_9SPHN|nr:AraC family transcriptional regulator [Erythrobacter insulae]TRD10927.1 AraC family transcriptional regulator [Erythrobacter insulae]